MNIEEACVMVTEEKGLTDKMTLIITIIIVVINLVLSRISLNLI